MKAIIIFLLAIIVCIMGYNFYEKWQRFHPPHYHYTTNAEIPENIENKVLLLNYQEAIQKLNGYVITQWSANGIDVRNPEDDDDVTTAAVQEYALKLATVKFFEQQIIAEKEHKEAQVFSENEKRKQLIEKMFYVNPLANEFKLGEKSALIYEVQRILIAKGDSIRHDGLYRLETQTSLKNFEAKNNLFPDGKLDALTLNALLK